MDARYDFREAEPRRQAEWERAGTYRFDATRGGQPFTIDTPPPTVSGALHAGHVYSYTHADLIARYHRMRGDAVFYPLGFDDNGLPTERFVEQRLGIKARDVGRAAFTAACEGVVAAVEADFARLFKRLGLSIDPTLTYSTIDDRSRRVAQSAFLELCREGRARREPAPSLWCPECGTAVAQAEVDDAAESTLLTTIAFSVSPLPLGEGQGVGVPAELLVATTRPELLAACVAVFVNPDDERYRSLVGQRARVPLFDLDVPVLADRRADREKGTGAVMCCTFGDATDVAWWRENDLPLRVAIGHDGRLTGLAGRYAGLPVRGARRQVLADLTDEGLVRGQSQVEHTLGVHERCGTPVEYLVAPQWFVRVLDRKQELLDVGRRIRWRPTHMRARYESWVDGLTWDWCISRQRTYGVPFPVWYCQQCGATVFAEPGELPVDPRETGPRAAVCQRCGGRALIGERDVMDTWATSSLTPRILRTMWPEMPSPMSLRPNAHDIIRTWDFYTIVRSLYGDGDVPWTDVLISGHSLDPRGKKISKSKAEKAEDPLEMLEQYSADAVRYWAAGGRLGGDTVLSEEVLRNGQRLVTKLWNAARFVQPHLEGWSPSDTPPRLGPADRWLLARLHETIERATAHWDDMEHAAAKAEVERFFWADLCDNYLELAKGRLYERSAGYDGAREALSHALRGVVGMLAPVMPHVTEEIRLALDGESGSIHTSRWPEAVPEWRDPGALRVGEALVAIADAARRWKADRKLSVAAPLAAIEVQCSRELVESLRAAEADLRSVTRAERIEFHESNGAREDLTSTTVGVTVSPLPVGEG